MNIVHRPIPDEQDQLVVLDARRRLYAALGSKGDAWHVIQPARLEDARVGDGKVAAGALVCCCPAGQYARTCWALRLAEAFEHPEPVEVIAWMHEPGLDNPAGAGEAVEAFRG